MRSGYVVHTVTSSGDWYRNDGYSDVLHAASVARQHMRAGYTSATVTYDNGIDNEGGDTVIFAYQRDARGRLQRVRCQPRQRVNEVFLSYFALSTRRAAGNNPAARRLCQAHMRRIQWQRANTLAPAIADRLRRYTLAA